MSFSRLAVSLVVLFVAVSTLRALAADPVPAYSTLAGRRALIDVPVYTAAEKKTVLTQATLLLKDLYVHREKKIALHGPGIDPLPALGELATEIERLPELEIHQRLERIFTSQRDLHTNYYYPKPYSCYRSVLPISLSQATDPSGRTVVAVRTFTGDGEILRLSPGIERVRVGDVVLSYDGVDPQAAAQALLEVGGGANDAAGLRRGLQNLTLRSQKLHLLPSFDTVKLVFKSRTGVPYSLELPWILKADLKCLGQEQEKPGKTDLTLAVDDYQLEYERLFKPVRAQPNKRALQTEPTAEPIVSYKVLNNEYGTFGFLRLDSFSPQKQGDDGTIAIVRGLLTKEFASTDGLIIDLRENGGGSIGLAERLVQAFTHANITPQGFRLLNTSLNHFIFEQGTQRNEAFESALARADQLGAAYADPVLITSVSVANSMGQAYFKPVAILTNSGCYSACDMFSAHMQDHGAAVIYGEDSATGGGGANVVAQSGFLDMFPEGHSGAFAPLPGGQDMRVAWRQTVRSGKNAGRLIEDEGISADRLAVLSLADFYSQDSQQIRLISADLNRVAENYRSRVRLDSEARADLLQGQPIQFGASVKDTTAVEFRVGDASIGVQTLGVTSTAHVGMSVPGVAAGMFGNIGSVELVGYLAGARAWRQVVSYRVIPESLVLASGDTLAYDFETQELGALTRFTTGGDARDGWVVRNGRLWTGAGPNYKDNLKMEASFFLDLSDKPAAKLSFNKEVHTEKDFDYFSVLAVVDGKTTELLKPESGDIDPVDVSLNLAPFAGKKVEIRFSFESDPGVTAKGVALDNVRLE